MYNNCKTNTSGYKCKKQEQPQHDHSLQVKPGFCQGGVPVVDVYKKQMNRTKSSSTCCVALTTAKALYRYLYCTEPRRHARIHTHIKQHQKATNSNTAWTVTEQVSDPHTEGVELSVHYPQKDFRKLPLGHISPIGRLPGMEPQIHTTC
jgi:hypothetical protein